MTRPYRVVIVGGGTAGWMTAAALSRLNRHAGVEITLIESDEIGTVGVGEATIPSIVGFNAMLGIREADFLRETKATYKLGIEFDGWGRAGERYMHPFGSAGMDMNGIRYYQFWLKVAQTHGLAEAGHLDEHNLCAVAARSGKFSHPSDNPATVLSGLKYAYHFDAGLYAGFLRRYSEARGVVRREGKIVDTTLHPESGDITQLVLENGTRVDGDLFVDCSGFRALLIGQALKVPYHDWSAYLPCNRALAVPCAQPQAPIPYTRATAEAAGWRWRIPLQHRLGNGYVYSAEFINDEAALSLLLSTLEGEPLAEPRPIRFTAGRRDRFWVKNCVAIGLSGGFVEPLESTSIHLIQSGIGKLVALFPGQQISLAERDEFNRLTTAEYEQVRDFIVLHYKATTREDTAFWRYCRHMDIPDSLKAKMTLFKAHGRFFRREDDLFTVDSWVAVLLGQGIWPDGYDRLVDAVDPAEVRRFTGFVRTNLTQVVAAMPSHQDFITRLIGAPIQDSVV